MNILHKKTISSLLHSFDEMMVDIVKVHSTVIAILFCFLFSNFLASYAIDTISPNEQLLSDENLFIDSSAGTFRLGFFTPPGPGSQNRFIGIWYRNINPTHFLWVANRDSPLDSDTSGVFQLSADGNLEIVSNGSSVLWTSGVNTTVRNPIAQLLESGNLVIREESDANPDNYIWQSFDYPTDTAMPGMRLGRNFVTGVDRVLRSWTNRNDPSTGNYSFFLDTRGYPSLIMYNGDTERVGSGPWNGVSFSGSLGLRPNDIYTYELVLNQEEAYYRYNVVDSSDLSVLYLNPEGIVQRLMWNNRTLEWTTMLRIPTDNCDTFALCQGYGTCTINRNPACSCLDRFTPTDPAGWAGSDWSSGCERRTPLNCSTDGFVRYSGLKLPNTMNSWYNLSMSTRECERMCLSNCSCTAYANTDIRGEGSGCLLWFGELIDMRNLNEFGQDIFVRMASSELDSDSSGSNRTRMILAVSLSVTATVLILGLFFILYKCKKKRYQQGKNELTRKESFGTPSRPLYVVDNKSEDLDLPTFDLDTIRKATNHFSGYNKIGQGGFGPVYKGTLDEGREIAVKRLAKKSIQGVDEFKNEVILLEKLQHRNLVKLLGSCIEEEEKMLVYEYMPNKSLDFFIFDKNRSALLDWPSRFRIIGGVARGLMYLHQDSRLRIIHRDLKAANILLDAEMNPRISDFGLARLFAGQETEARTRRIVGTYGYMSPEYAIDGNFSVKSDVFSYGVLVLEIIYGHRNRGFTHSDHHHNLLGHAWILHGEGRSAEMISANQIESLHIPELLRTIHVGLLCVQRNPEDRPSMSDVVLMLGSQGALDNPKEPGFFAERNLYSETNSSISYRQVTTSVNSSTMTIVEGR